MLRATSDFYKCLLHCTEHSCGCHFRKTQPYQLVSLRVWQNCISKLVAKHPQFCGREYPVGRETGLAPQLSKAKRQRKYRQQSFHLYVQRFYLVMGCLTVEVIDKFYNYCFQVIQDLSSPNFSSSSRWDLISSSMELLVLILRLKRSLHLQFLQRPVFSNTSNRWVVRSSLEN